MKTQRKQRKRERESTQAKQVDDLRHLSLLMVFTTQVSLRNAKTHIDTKEEEKQHKRNKKIK